MARRAMSENHKLYNGHFNTSKQSINSHFAKSLAHSKIEVIQEIEPEEISASRKPLKYSTDEQVIDTPHKPIQEISCNIESEEEELYIPFNRRKYIQDDAKGICPNELNSELNAIKDTDD